MGDFSGNHLAVEGKVLDWRRIRKGYWKLRFPI
jgi:hypothetical protein